MTTDLVALIQQFVQKSTTDFVVQMSGLMERCAQWDELVFSTYVPNELDALMVQIIKASQEAQQPPRGIAFSLRVASAIETQRRSAPQLELVLTGPGVPPQETRRTDETILELVRGAKRRLTLVSFANFRVERLSAALYEAVLRGVEIRFFVEAETLPHAGFGEVYRELVAMPVNVYALRAAHRFDVASGKHRVLHAKVTLADAETALISSANLTENAMHSNLEVGVLIRGGGYASKIERIFDTYLAHGLFEKLSDSV